MNARTAILGKLRAAATAQLPALPDVAQWYASRRHDEPMAARSARLCRALEAARTEVHHVTDATWPAIVLRLCAAKGLRQLLLGANTPHGAALQVCAPPSLQLVTYDQPIAQWQDQLFGGIDAALTLARSAIADTGSLILWPTPSEPRLMSLVPSVHFVLLDAAHIHADFHAALSAEGWAQGMPTNALLISGPSKTADIQQTLAYGAHGPKELVLLLMAPEGAAQGGVA